MKLLRVGPVGQEKPACLDATGVIRDLTGVTADFEGEGVSLDALEALKGVDLTALPAVEGNHGLVRLLRGSKRFMRSA